MQLDESMLSEAERKIVADFAEKTYEEIQEQYGGHILQADTDDIIEQEGRFFVWARPRKDCFHFLKQSLQNI